MSLLPSDNEPRDLEKGLSDWAYRAAHAVLGGPAAPTNPLRARPPAKPTGPVSPYGSTKQAEHARGSGRGRLALLPSRTNPRARRRQAPEGKESSARERLGLRSAGRREAFPMAMSLGGDDLEKNMTSHDAFEDLCKSVGIDLLQKGDMTGPPPPGPQRTPPPQAGPGAPTPPGAVPAPATPGAAGGPYAPPPGPPSPPTAAAADKAPPGPGGLLDSNEDDGVDPEVKKALAGCRFSDQGADGSDLVGTGEGPRLAKLLEKGEEKQSTDFSMANALGGSWK